MTQSNGTVRGRRKITDNKEEETNLTVFVASVIYAKFTWVARGTAVKHFFAKGETL